MTEPGQNRKIAALNIILCAHFYLGEIMNQCIEILKKMNNKAKKNGDIPVSAIILKDNKIIAKAYNKKYKNNNPFDHAEVLAIKKACKKLKTSNLIDCEMIVSLKPCKMCYELINECRLKKVYFIFFAVP